jgi:hypothetical protein
MHWVIEALCQSVESTNRWPSSFAPVFRVCGLFRFYALMTDDETGVLRRAFSLTEDWARRG